MPKARCEIFTSKMNDWLFYGMMASMMLGVSDIHCYDGVWCLLWVLCALLIIKCCCVKTDNISILIACRLSFQGSACLYMYIKVLHIHIDCYFAYFRHHAVNSYAASATFEGFWIRQERSHFAAECQCSHLYRIHYVNVLSYYRRLLIA